MREKWCVDRWYRDANNARRVRDWLITEQGVTQADLVQNENGWWAILYATRTKPPMGCEWHAYAEPYDIEPDEDDLPSWYANWRAEFVAERGLNV